MVDDKHIDDEALGRIPAAVLADVKAQALETQKRLREDLKRELAAAVKRWKGIGGHV